jgi:uncharacterized protein YndB with AHSA1/START domain
MTELTTIAPIVKTLHVGCTTEDAFRVFAAEIGTWWPTETHAINAGEVRDVVFEEREGGEVYEISSRGEKAHWATVLVWEPPSRLVLAWHVNPENPAPTEIEVRFRPEGDGTRVDLEHRHWERLGAAGPEGRDRYDSGWEPVLACYAASIPAK